MQITMDNLATNPRPSDWFTGSVLAEYAEAPSLEEGGS
jgi:hypothetical protein